MRTKLENIEIEGTPTEMYEFLTTFKGDFKPQLKAKKHKHLKAKSTTYEV